MSDSECRKLVTSYSVNDLATYIYPDDSIIIENTIDNDDLVVCRTQYEDKSSEKDDIIVIDSEVKTTIPNESCPICLENINSLSFTYPCFHKFCKRCITSWHLISIDCPVCKQKSSKLIYDVRTSTDYKEIPVKVNDRIDMIENHEHTYRNRLNRRQGRIRHNYEVSDMSNSEYLGRGVLISSLHHDEDDSEDTRLRRQIYRRTCARLTSSYLARRVGDSRMNRNKPHVEKLIPWIKREVCAIMPITADHNFAASAILHTLKRYDMESPNFRMSILPFLGENSDIFIDELVAFNSSSLPMDVYDRNTIYAGIPMNTRTHRNRLLRRRI